MILFKKKNQARIRIIIRWVLVVIVLRTCPERWLGLAKGALGVMQMSSFNTNHLNQQDCLE